MVQQGTLTLQMVKGRGMEDLRNWTSMMYYNILRDGFMFKNNKETSKDVSKTKANTIRD